MDLVTEMVLVLEHGVVVGVHADAVGEHLLLVVEVRVCAEVVGEVDTLVNGRSAAGASGVAVPSAPHGRRRRRRRKKKRKKKWGAEGKRKEVMQRGFCYYFRASLGARIGN